MNDSSQPPRWHSTLAEGAEVFSFEDEARDYIKVQPPPSERVRHSSTALLRRIIELGSFKPEWVRLAEEELRRRGIGKTPNES